MEIRELKVPTSPLLAPELTASAQVVYWALYIYSQLAPGVRYSTSQIANQTSLSKTVVKKSLRQLAALGWYDTMSGDYRPIKRRINKISATVNMPIDLLNADVKPQAKALYTALKATIGNRYDEGLSSYSYLSELVQRYTGTVRAAVHELVQAGWLEITQTNRLSPIRFKLRHPVTDLVMTKLLAAQKRLDNNDHYGETLMREFLTLIIAVENYIDNASPSFLENPLTGQLLQLDRFYPPDVAFEFNGPQHYHATSLYTKEEAEKQRLRDIIKHGLCSLEGITLIVIRPEDLALETMQQKVGDLLPLRDLYGYKPLVDYLENKSRIYRQQAQEWH